MESDNFLNLIRFISRENVKLKVKVKALEQEIDALHTILKTEEKEEEEIKNDRHN
jgi:hypothetical protein